MLADLKEKGSQFLSEYRTIDIFVNIKSIMWHVNPMK